MAIINFLLIPIWCVALLVVHESGHAIAGRILGFKVFWIRIGRGWRLAEFSVFAIKVKLNLALIDSATMVASPGAEWIRLRLWLAIAAGPGTHLGVPFL